MSSIYLSTIQGVVAGGAAAYLHDRAQQEIKLQTADTWISIALQVNHLLLLTAETMRFAAIPLNGFGTLVQMTYALTPLVLATGLRSKITPLEAKCARQLTALYRMGVVVTSLATALLGNPVFALTSLSMLAIDLWMQGKPNKPALDLVKKTCAIFALIGYGDQVFSAQSFLAEIAKVSTVIMSVKLCMIDTFKPSLPPRDFISRQPDLEPIHITIQEPIICPSKRPIYVTNQIVTSLPPPPPILRHTVVHSYPAPLPYHRSFHPMPCSRESYSHSPPSRVIQPPMQTKPSPTGSSPPRPSMLCRPSVW